MCVSNIAEEVLKLNNPKLLLLMSKIASFGGSYVAEMPNVEYEGFSVPLKTLTNLG